MIIGNILLTHQFITVSCGLLKHYWELISTFQKLEFFPRWGRSMAIFSPSVSNVKTDLTLVISSSLPELLWVPCKCPGSTRKVEPSCYLFFIQRSQKGFLSVVVKKATFVRDLHLSRRKSILISPKS